MMSQSNLQESLLSTQPMISLRSPDDQSGIIRFIKGYSPTCDLFVVAEIGGQTKLLCGHVQTSKYKLADILTYLQATMLDEAGIQFKILSWARQLHLVDVGYGSFQLYLGKLPLVSFMKSGEMIQMDRFILGPKFEGLDIYMLAELIQDILSKREYSNVLDRKDLLVSAIWKTINSFTELERVQFMEMYSVPATTDVSLDDASLRRIHYMAQTWRMKLVDSSVVFKWPNDPKRVFLTEQDGIQLAKDILSMAASSASPIILVRLEEPVSVLTSAFLVGFFKEALKSSGTEKAFRNRYKFIGFDEHMSKIDGAIKSLVESLYQTKDVK